MNMNISQGRLRCLKQTDLSHVGTMLEFGQKICYVSELTLEFANSLSHLPFFPYDPRDTR